MTHNHRNRLAKLESRFPEPEPLPRRVAILMQPHGPDVARMTEGEARARGRLWIPDTDTRPQPEDSPDGL
jgi:hypothetical protein